MQPVEFVKGHGTKNDFVLLPDRDNQITLTAELVRTLADRRAGIGGDGVIRVGTGSAGQFVMDYWNSDGSLAEMCGNGARVFARFLVDAGWASPGSLEFQTRGGVRTAELDTTGEVTVDLGEVRVAGTGSAIVAGQEFSGIRADVGNPHLVVAVDDPATIDLASAPVIDPQQFPEGVNVEFVRADAENALTLRVFERGAGETQSCGTGTAAAAAVHLAGAGRDSGQVLVNVPGGTVVVTLRETGRPGCFRAALTGPAVLSFSGTFNPALLD